MKIPAKFFPFAARQPLWDMAKKHGKMKYTIVAIWEYMYWRSGKTNLFELADDLVCLDLGCDTHTLCGVRKVLQAEGWLKKESLRDKGGKWLTRGWTVLINLAPTCAKSPSGEAQPHGHQPHGHQPHVDEPHADEPHVVDYTALYPPSSVILQSSEPTVSCDPSISVLTYQSTNQSVASEISTSNPISVLNSDRVQDIGSEAEEKTNPTPDEFAMPSGVVYNRTDILLRMGDCWSAFKHSAVPNADEFRLFIDILAKCDDNSCYPSEPMAWAQTHILNPKLLGALRSVKGLHKAICGADVSSTNGLLAQYKDHCKNPKACGICLKKVQGIKCAMGTCKNWVELGYDGEPTQYCKQCAVFANTTRTPCACGNNCKGFCKLEVEMELKPVAVGTGFSVEEAE